MLEILLEIHLLAINAAIVVVGFLYYAVVPSQNGISFDGAQGRRNLAIKDLCEVHGALLADAPTNPPPSLMSLLSFDPHSEDPDTNLLNGVIAARSVFDQYDFDIELAAEEAAFLASDRNGDQPRGMQREPGHFPGVPDLSQRHRNFLHFIYLSAHLLSSPIHRDVYTETFHPMVEKDVGYFFSFYGATALQAPSTRQGLSSNEVDKRNQRLQKFCAPYLVVSSSS